MPARPAGERRAGEVTIDVEEHRTGDMAGGEQPLGLRGAERGRPPHVGDHDLLAMTPEPRCVDEESVM